MRHCKRPCPACPWREEADPEAIENFSLELAEGLAETCRRNGYGQQFGDPLFACHESTPERELACAGWLAVEGHAHPKVRIAVMSDRIRMAALEPGEDWPALHPDFSSMIAKLRRLSR